MVARVNFETHELEKICSGNILNSPYRLWNKNISGNVSLWRDINICSQVAILSEKWSMYELYGMIQKL